jgi:hypothetical protein
MNIYSMMNILQKIIQIGVYILLLVSASCLVFAVYDFCNTHSLFSIPQFYFDIAQYSGLYKFTFIVLAAYLALEQLKVAQENYKKSLEQLKFTQDDILSKRENEIKNDTLNHATYYLTEMQTTIKELTEKGALNGMFSFYSINDVNNLESLKNNTILYKLVTDNVAIHHKDIVMTLNRFEAFSAMFIHGNLDAFLGRKIVGKIYCAQVGLICPFIALYRSNDHPNFSENTISLVRQWEKQQIGL